MKCKEKVFSDERVGIISTQDLPVGVTRNFEETLKHISEPPFYQFGLSINVSNAGRRRHYTNMTVSST